MGKAKPRGKSNAGLLLRDVQRALASWQKHGIHGLLALLVVSASYLVFERTRSQDQEDVVPAAPEKKQNAHEFKRAIGNFGTPSGQPLIHLPLAAELAATVRELGSNSQQHAVWKGEETVRLQSPSGSSVEYRLTWRLESYSKVPSASADP